MLIGRLKKKGNLHKSPSSVENKDMKAEGVNLQVEDRIKAYS
jgi:hypothetical protein